jgi:hypothetical protein
VAAIKAPQGDSAVRINPEDGSHAAADRNATGLSIGRHQHRLGTLQVSHLTQVLLLISVKLLHSAQLSHS